MESSETQANQSAAEVNSTASKTPEKKAQLAAYMREYRKRRKLASGAKVAIEAEQGISEPQSSPVEAPGAS